MTTERATREEIHRALEHARQELLDLTSRNRLLNTPRRRARSSSVEITGESAEQMYAMLVREGKSLTFLPREEPDTVEPAEPPAPLGESATDPDRALDQPDDEDELAARQRDRRLQTELEARTLQTRLLRTYYAARTFEEERGVNVLYLAVGFLEWRERDDPEKVRHAPLILIPVVIERRSAASRFRIHWSGDDLTTNLSLQARLRMDFALELPEVEEDDDLSPNGYFDRVEAAVEDLEGWRVHRDDAVLWFFSFARLLMYRDLDPANWPSEKRLEDHPLLRRTLVAGFEEDELIPPGARVDDVLVPRDAMHVLDADSSQALAIESARRGQNLVIQGPPGTGKSQTIANLIAASVRDGKRVLFVAEKVAALDVVKRRLELVGLGDLCLALHSSKANKRVVLEELARTLDLARPVVDDVEEQAERLGHVRDRLNDQCTEMHRPGRPSETSPYDGISELIALRSRGVAAPGFSLHGAQLWTRDEFEEKTAALRELADYVREVGPPAEHPWRGVMLDSVLPTDVERLGDRLPAVREVVHRLREAARRLDERFVGQRANTVFETRTLADLAAHRAAAPLFDRLAYADEVWRSRAAELPPLIAAGRQSAQARRELDPVLVESAWRDEVASIRSALNAHGRSWLRFLNRDYRRAVARLRGLCRDEAPKSLTDRLALLDRLIAARDARERMARAEETGRRAFGEWWRGEDTDFAALERIVAWDIQLGTIIDDVGAARMVVASVEDSDGLDELAAAARKCAEECLGDLRSIAATLALDVEVAFGAAALETAGLEAIDERLGLWDQTLESISQWIAVRVRAARARDEGLEAVADRLDDGRLDPEDAVDQFMVAYHETVVREMLRERLELSDFDGLSWERVRAEFRHLDEERLSFARREVAYAHYESIPRGGAGIGEMGVLRHEMNKKRRHLPLRQLLRRAGGAVSAIKPVFMMSPLSIAQYVEPGALEFDLLVVDEASQVRPVDALGAVARCAQLVVVGDDRQLPPTAFFRRVMDDDGVDIGDELPVAGDLESILGLCAAQNVPSRMLRWHYRSRHHSLIAVSNREFYGGRLLVIPSPSLGEPGLGLDFVHVADGIFDRGRTAVNLQEAEAVAEAVMEHAESHPDVSLGVGAFSVTQRDAILDALERRRRREKRLESFFATDLPEPFFVKNLENIQGDERDVIFISVGYARDTEGRLTMNFGPLSAEGGERRLNVLISRARRQCVVFSSIHPENIDLRRATGLGPRALRTFLLFARDGELEDAPTRASGEPTDTFERIVAEEIRSAGWQVHAHVGIAGIFVDLAIVDPDDPRRYILGIECDGRAYHDAPSARDRDRLRESVLIDRGWRLHRLWIRDWFQRPDDQAARLLNAIEAAAADARSAREQREGDALDDEELAELEADPFTDAEFGGAIEREAHAPVADDQITGSVPYREASFPVPKDVDIADLGPQKLGRIVLRVVKMEGPIHRDEVAQRVRTLWGLSRTGARITRLVRGTLEAAESSGDLASREGFYRIPGSAVTVRDRENVTSPTLRNLSMLPPLEVEACLTHLIESHLGVTREQIASAAARLLGFRSTSKHLRGHMMRRLDGLIARGVIEEDDGRLHLAEREAE